MGYGLTVTPDAIVIGGGPAGLMAATQMSRAGLRVKLFDKRKGIGWKLFVAGSSGLNISNAHPIPKFARSYQGATIPWWEELLGTFGPREWLQFIEEMGLKTFLGTSGRYFVTNMNAVALVRAWKQRLMDSGVEIVTGAECQGVKRAPRAGHWRVDFAGGLSEEASAVCFALGGGSYEPTEKPIRWATIFRDMGVPFQTFEPSNAGHGVEWSYAFLQEADGKPLKNVTLATARGVRQGDLVVTSYGLEGTPIYEVGEPGPATLDLKPDLSLDQIRDRLLAVRENLSPMRRVARKLKLCKASEALIFHTATAEQKGSIDKLVPLIKSLPLYLGAPRSLDESISSRGGVAMEACTAELMLKNHPGIFLAGEMLDWDAPTGGFLIQACVSMGYRVGSVLPGYVASLEGRKDDTTR